MKKLILMLLVLTGGILQANAADLRVYMKANAWDVSDATEKFAVFAQGAGKTSTTINMTLLSGDYYYVDLDEGYTTINLVRYDGSTDLSGQTFLGNYWNISGEKTISTSNNYFIFTNNWNDGSDKSVFTETAAHKIFVKNKQNGTTPKFYAWDGSNNPINGSWPGTDMDVDGDWYSYLNLTGTTTVNGLFLLTDNTDQCDNLSFDLSSSDVYYYYYPDYQMALPSSQALETPAKIYVQANVASAIKAYTWNYPTGASWYGGSPFTLTTETVDGKEWYTFETPFPSFSGQFFTYDNGGDDHNKTATYDFTFTSGETAYFFANVSAKNLGVSKYEPKYYLVYRSKSSFDDIDVGNNDNSYVEMTNTGDFTFKGTLDNTDGNNIYFLIAPESAVSIDGESASITQWNQCFFFNGSGYYEIKWQNMADNVTTASWQRWMIKADDVKANYDITFNFSDLTFTSTPFFTRTIADNNGGGQGYATFSSDYAVAVPTGVTAYYSKAAASGAVTMTKFTTGIAAGDGAFLAATPGTYTFTPATDSPAAISGNLLKAATGSDIWDGSNTDDNYQYVFAKQNGKLGFFKVTKAAALAKGKAYLGTTTDLAVAGGRVAIVFDGETTDINGITIDSFNESTVNDGAIYDLQGRRVDNNYRGIVIKNGKKVVIK